LTGAAKEAAFREADLFILPTHSENFGIAVAEAMAHGLPVIVSEKCARLVQDDVQGRVLAEVSPTAIADALRSILANTDLITRWSAACEVPDECRIGSVTHQMRGVLESIR
jgi:glycosyltransferase involved in cell wall biosynthesis